MRLSVIVITRNEAGHIGACLDSVAFADEIVVLDSGSTDDTVAIARARGARVEVVEGWPGFGPQKNRVLDLATGEWVLSIDADERVTPELAAEIQAVLAAPAHEAYNIPRLSSYCGRFMRHGGWWPDYVLRLFKRGTARYTDALVHEKVVPSGSVGRLKAHFLHYTYPDLDSALAKMNRYTTDSARMLHARGKRATIWKAIGHGAWAFIRVYFLRRGFLDGRHGFLLAGTSAGNSFYRYAKLMLLEDAQRAAPPAVGHEAPPPPPQA